MPRISLKQSSPEFDDPDHEQKTVLCDMPGCSESAAHKAPKDRSLKEYYRFCLQHVQEYNRAWNYFEGMSADEIQDHILKSAFGDRPTWRFAQDENYEDALRRRAWQAYHNTDKEPPESDSDQWQQRQTRLDRNTPEYEALTIMGLEPPTDLKAIKTRYKDLAKQYHPDRNQGDREAEELLKSINMAYTILKAAYEQYETMLKKHS